MLLLQKDSQKKLSFIVEEHDPEIYASVRVFFKSERWWKPVTS